MENWPKGQQNRDCGGGRDRGGRREGAGGRPGGEDRRGRAEGGPDWGERRGRAGESDRRGGARAKSTGGDRRGGGRQGSERGRDERKGVNRENNRLESSRETTSLRHQNAQQGERGGGHGQRGSRVHVRGTSRDGTHEVRKLGFKTLEELLQKDASVVVITLSSNVSLQALLRETTMRQDLVQMLCQVLCKAFQSRNDRRIVLHLAQVLKDSSFFQIVLPHYVTGIMTDHVPARRQHYPQYLENIIDLMSALLSMFPSSSIRSISMLVALLKPVVNQLRASGIHIRQTVDEELEKIQGMVEHLQEKARDGTLRSDTYTVPIGNDDSAEGVEDFRNMTIYPTPEEFRQDQKPFLRANIMSKSYPSAHIYLDTHFRLLREDFVRPLREGIRELLQSQQDESLSGIPIRKRRFDDIRVYFDTRLVMPLCTPTGTAYRVKFDTQPLQFVRWENSKRLLYGSLVCLSMDNFETFLFATVSNRDPTELKNGQVMLSFCRNSRAQLATIQLSQSFLMVETTAYFEAYRYVLEGLQEQQEEDLPFQRYIVECSPDVRPPVYFLPVERTYDLACIAADGRADSVKPFNPLNPTTWPTEEQMGLDDSQLKALKLALTKELAIIQGPPGTGKTYVGLKIAKALLRNNRVWSANCPMLVVCYTNHALDQFLEGIHSFLPKGIVRVGGRSNSEMLKKFSLRELTRLSSFHRDLPAHLKRAYHEIQMEMQVAQNKLNIQSSYLVCSLRGVINENFLQKYISDNHWYSLNSQSQMIGEFVHVGKKQSLIMEWLCLGVFQQQTGNGEAEAKGEEEHGEDEQLLEVDEQAALIEADRILDDSDPKSRDVRDRRKEEETIEQLSKQMLALNLHQVDDHPSQEQGQGQANEEVWEMQPNQKKKIRQRVRGELSKSDAMSEDEEQQVWNVWHLKRNDRWRLYRLWLLRYHIELRRKALQAEQIYQDAAERLAEVRRREDLCVLRNAKVIGMTTTGAAKYRQVLQELKPKLVIVEEAAEVLEAHTITTLSQECQHLILIGDHQQLRPSATVFELAKHFNLEVSMFERLVKVGFPFVRLNYQHRMRPDIARLLTPHIYSELENHPSVLEYDSIKGILTNIFFLNHKSPEEEIKDGRSHENRYEACFVVELCRYLLRQDYQPSQITILTTYTGQLYCLRKLMPSSEFSGVKVHVVDKYQGEENDIVILSLVRSNPDGKVGFLQIPNRVCVALSRAKMGLYCVGNMDMFSKVKLWSDILHTLREKAQVGSFLTLSCQNHPKTQTLVSSSKDFLKVPEGGCNKPCEFRLDCGHVCTRMCHPYDADHKKFKCSKDCTKVLCELEHKCPKQCYQKCGQCRVPLEKVVPKCHHKQTMPCHQDPEEFVCREPCTNKLECGHPCQASCGETCTVICKVRVPMKLKCGHIQTEPCTSSKDLQYQPFCKTKCHTVLKCGHPCTGNCHNCHQGRLHKACTHQCQRVLPCSHKCHVPCPKFCPPCTLPCQNRCVHSMCMRKCGQPCVPCMEPCEWQCPHHSCSKLCHEPCDRPPCSMKCNKVLPCRHPCIGLCGDPCPDKCRICHRDDVIEIFFGNEDESDACFIQLEDCKHIIESTGMDRYMSMDEDEEADLDQRAIRLKECPRCRTPIRRNVRYGAHINRSLEEIEKVKEQINGLQSVIQDKQNELQLLLKMKNNIMEQLPEEYLKVTKNLQGPCLSLLDLWHQENLITYLESIAKLMKMQKDHISSAMSGAFALRISECLNFLCHRSQRFSDQQIDDLEREMKRLSYLAELNVRCSTASYIAMKVKVNAEVTQAMQILECMQPFTKNDEDKVKEIFKELENRLPQSGLGITDEERLMIVKAMAFSQGHWYKCPNGHVYAIGDCGGAMERSQCPECKATIGGTNHALTEGNSVAGEMDGAQHAAWSNTANLINFIPRDI